MTWSRVHCHICFSRMRLSHRKTDQTKLALTGNGRESFVIDRVVTSGKEGTGVITSESCYRLLGVCDSTINLYYYYCYYY